jgi:hypothetical protein
VPSLCVVYFVLYSCPVCSISISPPNLQSGLIPNLKVVFIISQVTIIVRVISNIDETSKRHVHCVALQFKLVSAHV